MTDRESLTLGEYEDQRFTTTLLKGLGEARYSRSHIKGRLAVRYYMYIITYHVS